MSYLCGSVPEEARLEEREGIRFKTNFDSHLKAKRVEVPNYTQLEIKPLGNLWTKQPLTSQRKPNKNTKQPLRSRKGSPLEKPTHNNTEQSPQSHKTITSTPSRNKENSNERPPSEPLLAGDSSFVSQGLQGIEASWAFGGA